MIAIDEMFRQPMAQALGWALLQFLWQGTLIGVLTALLLALLRRSAADVRYVVSAVAMALMLTMPVVTAIQTYAAVGRDIGQGLKTLAPPDHAGAAGRGLQTPPVAEAPVGPGLQTPPVAEAPVGPGLQTPPVPEAPVGSGLQTSPVGYASVGRGLQTPPTSSVQNPSARWPVEQWLPLLVGVWLAGVAMLTLRLLSGWIWVQRMKSFAARPVHQGLEEIAQRLMRRLHIGRAVRVLESGGVDVPTVIGWLKPVVLLPVTALSGLTPRQVEAILAHELAHIRRHDYLVNLLQTVVETLLFYHPAVWWLSRRIRVEREHCCDDLAVSLCGDPVAYAAALAELEGLRSSSRELALAATGGSLLHRVKRVLGAPSHAGRAPGWLAAGVAMLVIVALSASAVNTDALIGIGNVDADQIAASTPAAPVAAQSPAPIVAAPAPADPPAVVVATTRTQAATAGPQIAAVIPVEAPVAIARAAAVVATTAPPVTSEESIAAAMATTAMAVPAVVASPTAASAAPVVASTSASSRQSAGESSGNFVWSDNGEKLEINYRGEIEFTADDTDVARLSPGGMLRIKDGRRWFGAETTVEFIADGGNIRRRFWVGWTERPFEPEGRKWLATMLPRFIRQSGIGAPARVARIHKSGGVTGVLAEISRIEGSWAKRRYYTELIKLGLSTADIQRALTQAGSEIESDFELASLLISSNKVITDDGARRAYLDAARSIGSDFEMRRVLSSILKTGQVAAPIATGVLDASTAIDSDFEEASLLIEFARQQPLDATVRAPFFKALATISSSFERSRVLQTLLQRADLSPEARAAALESTAGIESNFEAASVLVQFAKSNPIEGATRAPFFRAVGSIDSAFERGRVLQVLAKRSDLSDDTVLDLIKSAQGINSNFERAQVLLTVASNHMLTRPARDAYIDAADKLGDFEQGRVLSALVKNERRSPAR